MPGSRQPRGRFLALQPAQACLEPLEVTVAHDAVTALGGRLLLRRAARRPSGARRGGGVRILGMLRWNVLLERRIDRVIVALVALGRFSFCGGAGPVRHVGRQIDGNPGILLMGYS